jgi:hypothetical protein
MQRSREDEKACQSPPASLAEMEEIAFLGPMKMTRSSHVTVHENASGTMKKMLMMKMKTLAMTIHQDGLASLAGMAVFSLSQPCRAIPSSDLEES